MRNYNIYIIKLLYRSLVDLVPNKTKSNNADNKMVVDGADGVDGEKHEVLKKC